MATPPRSRNGKISSLFKQENNIIFNDEKAEQINPDRKSEPEKYDEIQQSLYTIRDVTQRVLFQDHFDQNSADMNYEAQEQSREKKEDDRQATGEDDYDYTS